MYRFFVEESQIYDGTVHITGSDVNHIKNVLRMRPGEKILVSTGGEKEYHCAVSDFPEGEVLAAVEEVTAADRELPSGIVLFQGLPKGDKMELIIQKAVELGATEIVPVEMKRCVVKLRLFPVQPHNAAPAGHRNYFTGSQLHSLLYDQFHFISLGQALEQADPGRKLLARLLGI